MAYQDNPSASSHADRGGYSLPESQATPRHSDESATRDDEVLRQEEEVEELLTGQTTAQSTPRTHSSQRRRRNGARNARTQSRELLHEMEEGGPRSRTPSSQGSISDLDYPEKPRAHSSRGRRAFRFTILHIAIAALFVAIAYGAYKATRETAPDRTLSAATMRSNGSSLFAPTTILISLDGFRADYLDRGLSPTLKSFILEGVSPKFMLPSFPSVTFPNHYTLATGLYPESHGIVGNSFFDPALQDSFYYTDYSHSMQPKWWNGEPFWETAEAHGVSTAIHMWPGSEAHIGSLEPTYIDKFNGSELLDVKVARILEFVDKPGPSDAGFDPVSPRPQLIAAYVPNVDAMGHKFGPNSTEVDDTISQVDALLHNVLTGLELRNLTNIVNIIVVSDHGMASTDESRVIQLEEILDTTKIAHMDGWPHYGLRPHDEADILPLYETLLAISKVREGFDVYLRDENMPERWHFSNNERIAPLWIIPHTGWAIAPKAEFDVTKTGSVYHPKGIHGYDHEDPLMRAIFVARGPAFPHTPGSKLDPFQNTEVYNIICDSVGFEPRPNNGTLRLPLKPVGHHLDDVDEKEDDRIPGDPENKDDLLSAPTTVDASEPVSTSGIPDRPVIQHEDDDTQPQQTAADKAFATAKHWWEWVSGQVQDFTDWVKDLAQKNRPGHDDDDAAT